MSLEELSTLFKAAREDFEVENGQPTDAYLFKTKKFTTFILLLAPYDEENGNQHLVGLVWSTERDVENSRTPTHHGQVVRPRRVRTNMGLVEDGL